MQSASFILISCFLALAANGQNLRLTPGATRAQPGEFPHQVTLHTNGGYQCGAALITRTHVLTAAHCVEDIVTSKTSANLTVQVGSVAIGHGQTYSVKRISAHKDYMKDHSDLFVPNDIAVVTLSSPVVESAYVRPIGLPEYMSELATGTTVTVSGFGTDGAGGWLSNYLLKLDQTIVSQQDCSQYYSNNPSIRRAVAETHICATGGVGYGTCYGDSGSPLIRDNRIIGIVSGGNGVCGSGYPDVYTKVSHFISYVHYELHYDRETIEFYCNSPALAVNL